MGKRGPARDRLSDVVADGVRQVARHVRDIKGLTNEKLADLVAENGHDWDSRRVRDTLASTKPLRAVNAVILLRTLKNARPKGFSRDDKRKRTVEANGLIAAALATVERWTMAPPALIPIWAIPTVAAVLAERMSQVRPAMTAKEQESVKARLERVLERSARGMAQQFYHMCGKGWVEGSGVDRVLKGYGEPPHIGHWVYEKEME